MLDSTIRHYICSLQERGKYTFYAVEDCAITYGPTRRRDFSQTVSTTTINNYIRNLKAFFAWYADTTDDLDMGDRTICLPAESTNDCRTWYVFFSVKTAKCLQGWLRYKDRYTSSKLMFPKKCGQPLEIHFFESGFKRYLGRAGIDMAYSPHALRNNFAKRCLMNGMDIYPLSQILGHSRVSVTENAHPDLTDRDLRHRYQNFSPMENLK
ncbi:MAG: tyrosine-type recombinase/integrase [Oscillospiraceae bacterium]|nr:tyrosine-type recombinase/integrase [Oscillospiraceae bacterium]